MKHIHLATALAVRDGRVLLVASHYSNHPQPLWNLPGGRQQAGELLSETAVRECFEETGYEVAIRELAYVSESYDRDNNVHFVNATFVAEGVGESSFDKLRMTREPVETTRDHVRTTPDHVGTTGVDDHVVDVEWVAIEEVEARVVVRVVREPLVAYLSGELRGFYAGYADAGITIRWPCGGSE